MYTPRSQLAGETAIEVREGVVQMLPDDIIRPVKFYWCHTVHQVRDGELVKATVWSSKKKLNGATASKGRYGFEIRVSEATKKLAKPGKVLPRPVYLRIALDMDDVELTPQIGDKQLLVLV